MAMLSVRLFREVFSQVSLFSSPSICSAEYLLTSALVNADAVSFKSLLRTLTVTVLASRSMLSMLYSRFLNRALPRSANWSCLLA